MIRPANAVELAVLIQQVISFAAGDGNNGVPSSVEEANGAGVPGGFFLYRQCLGGEDIIPPHLEPVDIDGVWRISRITTGGEEPSTERKVFQC